MNDNNLVQSFCSTVGCDNLIACSARQANIIAKDINNNGLFTYASIGYQFWMARVDFFKTVGRFGRIFFASLLTKLKSVQGRVQF
jgi:hypothetical protein